MKKGQSPCAGCPYGRVNPLLAREKWIEYLLDELLFDKLISEDENSVISANFYEALAGMNIAESDTAVELIAQWCPVVKSNRCEQDRITLTHDYYQPIVATIEKLRETINTHTKIVGRVKKLESIPDASKRTNGKVTIVYLDELNNKKTVSVQLAKDDYNKAIEAHEAGSHVEVIGEIEDNGKRKRSMMCESFSIID
jgi:hypothetical protein